MPLDLSFLTRIPNVLHYALAPHGDLAAVAWDKSGQSEIYLISLTGDGVPRLITTGPESKLHPSFSPDGKFLAFAQDYNGNECFDICLYDLTTGQTRNLTPSTPEIINPEIAWAPDGKHLAFTSNREGKFATYTLSLQNPADIRRVTRHAYSDDTICWSPDGTRLAITALVKGQETWVFIVPAEGGDTRPLSGPGGPVDASAPCWSPDSKQLAFISSASGLNSLYTYNLAAGALIRETPPTREAAAPVWSRDGQKIAFTWNEDGNVSLGVKDLASGDLHHFRVGAGVHESPQFTPDGTRLLALHSSAHQTSDLWLIPLGKGQPRPVTRSMPPQLNRRDFSTPELVHWPSDHFTISGWLYKPREFKKGLAPAILYVHGGPTWQYQNAWYPAVQHLVSAGFVVLCPNYRGSTGYGKTFQEANRFDLGGGDMRDVVAGAEFLARAGYADPRRIALTGPSYGGYLTMTALTKHPKVFAAGSAVVPFLNWFTEYASEREDLKYWDQQNFGDPVRDSDRYRQYSPLFFMENIVAPVQMLAGAHDPRCPADETRQAAQVLSNMNVPHDVFIYPDEGHGFRKVSNRLDAFRRRADFLMIHLGLKKAPTPKKAISPVKPKAKPVAQAKKKAAPKKSAKRAVKKS